MQKIIIFNPRSANAKHRLPNTILQVAASIHGKFEYVLVDGNMEKDPWTKIDNYLKTGEFAYFGCTVMPGPQLTQAIPITINIKEKYPDVVTIWGGYFPSNQYKSVISSNYVDFIIDGPGDYSFPALITKLHHKEKDFEGIRGLIYRENGEIKKTSKGEIPDYNVLPPLPYEALNQFYPLTRYMGKTFLGNRTIAYHSSFGCPFTCSFCAVVPIYNARWKGKNAALIYEDIKWLKDKYQGDSLEFHDNNFFVSEKRTAEFARLIMPEKINWWGEGRIDTIDKYSEDTLHLMRESGCKMIFYGAETGNDTLLKKMDKGGTQTGEQILRFAERMKKVDIIPEYSFVLGFPDENPDKVMAQINADIAFIKEVKAINPATEIIIYIYSPVPTEGTELFERVKEAGFHFPEKLTDWLAPEWERFDLRKNPLTPWLTPDMIDKIKNFETVLNGYYPTASDIKLSAFQKKLIQMLAAYRYKNNYFAFPYEIKVLHKLWKYRQPEIQGFEML